MAAVLLALAASASWGVSDFLGGLKSRAAPVLTVLSVSQPAGLVLLGAIVLVRWQAPPHGLPILWAVLAGIGGAVGIGALYQGLAVGSMGIVAPITSTSPLIPLTVGLARGERPSAIQLAGIGVAIVGGRLRRLGAGVRRGAAPAQRPARASPCLPPSRSAPRRSRSSRLPPTTRTGRRSSSGSPPRCSSWRRCCGFAPGRSRGRDVGRADRDRAARQRRDGALRGRDHEGTAQRGRRCSPPSYPVLVAILARVVLHERLTVVQSGGAVAAVAGAAAISAAIDRSISATRLRAV